MTNKRSVRLLFSILFLVALAAAAYFRLNGLFWGEYQYLHPDERFLIWVGTDISPVKDLAEYFDTANSPLNPHNRGHGFYVYGTLPMFLARYVVEWVYGHSGFDVMTEAGRSLSALADILTVVLVYLTARRLYDERVALLSMAFSAAVVLQIQQSHFFTMDTFTTFFSFLAFYFAVRIITAPAPTEVDPDQSAAPPLPPGEGPGVREKTSAFKSFLRDPFFLPSLGFGIALGMAVASKLNAAPMAVVLPAAMGLHLLLVPAGQREKRLFQVFLYLVLAGAVSLLVFRIFQPYAFSGPGFFGVAPNEKWVQNIREQRAQSGGDVDFPPAMQWARRPVWFSFQNMVLWGFGLPLGLLAWAGFLWAGWRLLIGWEKDRREWLSHALLWGWTAIYFTWQSLQLNPTMRYQLPIYPTLVIFAGWAIIALYDAGKNAPSKTRRIILQTAAVAGGLVVLALTFAYAYGFTQIYSRAITRVAASRWIYQNVPGPINLQIQPAQGDPLQQIIPFPYEYRIMQGVPFKTVFTPQAAGTVQEIYLPRVKDESGLPLDRTLTAAIRRLDGSNELLATAAATANFAASEDPRGQSVMLALDHPVELDPEQSYELMLELSGTPVAPAFDGRAVAAFQTIESGPVNLVTQTLSTAASAFSPNTPLSFDFVAEQTGALRQLHLPGMPVDSANPPQVMEVSLSTPAGPAEPLTTLVGSLPAVGGQGYDFILSDPLPVMGGEAYRLALTLAPQGGMLSLNGMGLANEGDWDDGLPLRLDGYDGYGGIYPRELNFNMYWDDNQEKLERFTRILDEADYLSISSNRQWGSLPRLPERFPMTSLYYRELLGCPPEQTVETCYRVARPGMYTGRLGYQLVQTFTSEPAIGSFPLNDQFAEEAFSVYDHPKVLIFQKTANYDPQQVRAILGQADLSKVIRVAPMRAANHPMTLMLPEDRLAEQRAGGTWSELFDTNAPQNRYPLVAVLAWYLAVTLLGIIAYPLLRLAVPGLADRGYPLARITGLLLLAYLVWLAGSLRIPFTRLTITLALALMTAFSFYLLYRQRAEIAHDLHRNRRYFLLIEGLALAAFLYFLTVRFGNPDLWHPWKGGEKPMDFSYFNAVLKSTSFPPYDPWYAGGYLNYYYYGFVLAGVLVKWLGIVPAVAYNLILPSLFSMIALGAFSIAWNLASAAGASRARRALPPVETSVSPWLPGLAAAAGVALLGNQGTIRMLYQGFQRLAAPGGNIEDASLLIRPIWALRGFLMNLQGQKLPFGIGDWYWLPSRAIPAPGDIEPITEFPYFSLLYADLHAHLLALPVTLLALALAVAIVLGRGRWKSFWGGGMWFFLSALAIGALRPTNTWDMPTYLALGVVAILYAWGRYYKPGPRIIDLFAGLPVSGIRALVAVAGAGLLVGLSFLLYRPYAQWYALGYTQVGLWEGTHTPFTAYLVHWGLFLFLILPWMAWETRDWLDRTPLSALDRLAPYRPLVWGGVALLIAAIAATFWLEIRVGWFILPIGAWATILLLRPNQADAKRIVLFLVGTGLVLTLMVEIIVLKGDIGRMNTVFKFYLQVWTLFAISAAASLAWLWPAQPDWRPVWRYAWQTGLALLVAGAALYTMTATLAKIDDRMAREAPLTLDGMAYMRNASYADEWGLMNLVQDYDAIRWMQENVQGSPVIVEANLRNLYRWGSRYSIYTGLPGVAGWEWHQQQQRAVTPGIWVSDRIAEIDQFYNTINLGEARAFLEKYDVRYIVVGQQERGHYPGPGLAKFDDANGLFWREVYRSGDTVIYEVTLP